MEEQDDNMAALKLMEGQDTQYLLHDWGPQCQAWTEMGVYPTLANFLALRAGDHHVDMGCGLGLLALEARRQFPDTVIWGVDRTRVAVLTAAKIGNKYSIASQVHAIGGMQPDPESDMVAPVFIRDEKRLSEMHLFEPGGPIQFIMDDVRTMHVVTSILGERKIDSASFVFPGYGPRAAYEAPYTIESTRRNFSDEIAAKRVARYMSTVRRMALFFATEAVREGGRLMVVERGISPHSDDIVTPLRKLMARTGLLDYWSIEEDMSLGSVTSPKGSMAWSTIDESGTHHRGRTVFASAFKLCRTSDPDVQKLKEHASYSQRPKTGLIQRVKQMFS